MEDSRIPRQAILWELSRATRESLDGQGKLDMDIIRRDLKDMDTTWDEAEELATDRAGWRQRLAPNASIWMRSELRC